MMCIDGSARVGRVFAAIGIMLFVLFGAGCGTLQGVGLLTPELSGLEPAAPGLYVEAGMPAQQRAELIAAKSWAEDAIHRAYGDVLSSPIVHACWSEKCYERFSGMGSVAKVYGDRILVSPRGLNGHFITHEWSHAELHKRLTLSGYFRVPSWFDEGVAVAISEAPEHSEAHWQYLVEYDVPRPDRAELMRMKTLRQWLDAVHRYGEDDNQQRMARGEARIAPVYAAAGHEVRLWLASAGTFGLLALIDQVNAGVAFDTAYCAVVSTQPSLRQTGLHGNESHLPEAGTGVR